MMSMVMSTGKRRRFGLDRVGMCEKIVELANLTKDDKNTKGYFSKKQMGELLNFLMGVRNKDAK